MNPAMKIHHGHLTGFCLVRSRLSQWVPYNGQQSCSLAYDGNLDGAVGSADLIGLLAEFGYECTPDMEFTWERRWVIRAMIMR